ncbi:chemokine-like factor isoform X5 [Cavia porcellus]|uniref:chemokine-like factor isoform X5 n=1 Tax=Cavia porcellus TaxID=10141 RepID=UPI000C87D2D5|nr:chemokine-like factor isoform X3 [Cavia porcellus]
MATEARLKAEFRLFCFSAKGPVKILRLDIINSMVTTLFMIIVSLLALIKENTTLIIIGGVFGFVTALCCIADGLLVYRKLLFHPSGPYQKSNVQEEKEVL